MQKMITELTKLIGADKLIVNNQLVANGVQPMKQGDLVRILVHARKPPALREIDPGLMQIGKAYMVTVSSQMTNSDTQDFKFHDTWNSGVPMPLRTMFVVVYQETRGMYQVLATAVRRPSMHCMMCGKAITHPVSRLYGLGPECSHHLYINPFSTEEELEAHLDEVDAKFAKVQWKGWIIKKHIISCEEVNI